MTPLAWLRAALTFRLSTERAKERRIAAALILRDETLREQLRQPRESAPRYHAPGRRFG